MNVRLFAACALGLALGAGCLAQDPTPPADGSGQSGIGQTANPDGHRGNRGMGPGGMMGMGRGIMGTVTEVTPDHFLVKNAGNEIYTIHYSANTRLMKQPPPVAGAAGQERPMGGGTPPQPIKAADIKVGDAIAAGGETDEAAKSVGAVFVLLLDPERAHQMKEMQANFGKTWLMGRVTAINETKVTLHSGVDNADHSFAADENTKFRRRRDPVTLADVQVGDNVRVEGAMKDGQFVATTVAVMMPPVQGGPVKRPGNEAPN